MLRSFLSGCIYIINMNFFALGSTVVKCIQDLKDHELICTAKTGSSNVYYLNDNFIWKSRGTESKYYICKRLLKGENPANVHTSFLFGDGETRILWIWPMINASQQQESILQNTQKKEMLPLCITFSSFGVFWDCWSSFPFASKAEDYSALSVMLILGRPVRNKRNDQSV